MQAGCGTFIPHILDGGSSEFDAAANGRVAAILDQLQAAGLKRES
jgi:hypothetical protein